MSLSQIIQRQRYMEMKGHNVTEIEKRDVKADRVLIKKLNKCEAVTKEPKVISSLYDLLKGL